MRRYAGDEARQIVVVDKLEVERRWLPARRRPRPAEPGEQVETVDVTRITVIDTAGAEPGLPADPEAEVAPALALLNRVLATHRVASADPYAGEVRRETALSVRVGYGDGEEVAAGRWTEAVSLPDPRPRRSAIAPQEHLAAVLAAREVVLTCEELALRAQGDLDAGRRRELAFELRNALPCAVTELAAFSGITGMTERIAELEGLAEAVEGIAAHALEGIGDEAQETLRHALGRLQAALRARLAVGPS